MPSHLPPWFEDQQPDTESPTARHWASQLTLLRPETKKQVELAVKRWNPIVRDMLRNETGLRFSTEDAAVQVPIRVADGLPLMLVAALNEYDEHADLLLKKGKVEAAHAGLEGMFPDYERWRAFSPVCAVPDDVLGYTLQWLETILMDISALQIEDALRRLDTDCLGSYAILASRIEIYWVAIGIYSQITGATVEGLTLVTLAHELAHAYTHRGKDIDGGAWENGAFVAAENPITEGLAQFYTQAVCRRLEDRFPAALTAFEALLKLQSGAYTDFVNWMPDFSHRGEATRFTMIQARSLNITSYGQFRQEMEKFRMP